MNKQFYFGEVVEGGNSVLFNSSFGYIFYEKLANTIHSGSLKNLKKLHKKAEFIEYNPKFESDTLKKGKGKKLESLLFNVTESCNLSCSYCVYSGNYENERTETKLNMGFETAKKAIDIFMPLSKETVLMGFYGGEPLNNIYLIKKIINYSKSTYPKKIIIPSMTSNFCGADKYIKEIVENEIYINISLDGPKQIHDKNRKFKDGTPTYNKIIENLRKFEEVSPGYIKTHFFYNATCRNPNDLPEIIRFFQENEQITVSRISGIEYKGFNGKVEMANVSNIFTFASDYLNSILSGRDPKIFRKLFDKNLRDIATRNIEVMPKQLMLNGCCYPSNKKLFVDTGGTFYICEKFGRRVPIGDVDNGLNQNSIDETIDKFTEIRNNLCTRGCWAQRLCNVCIQSSKEPKKNISESGLAQVCNQNKSQILVALTNYVCLSQENQEIFKNYISSI